MFKNIAWSLVVLSFLLCSCGEKTCADLKTFKNKESAIALVEEMNFPYDQTHTFLNTEWIKEARFKSCDNASGFLIYSDRNTNAKHMHQDVPMDIWLGLLQDAYKGNFYNVKIRGKYKVQFK